MLYSKLKKVFYGWWIVGASFFIALYMGGVIFYGFTAFVKPIAEDLRWSYTQISLAASLRGAEMGLLAPLVGTLADRWGPRRLIFTGAIITASGLILLAGMTSLGMFYGAFALIAIGTSASTVTMLIALANWFRRKVGIASGIAICGFGFSGLLVPVIVTLIEVYEWRTALIVLALGMLIVVLPLSLLFRHKPEQYGHLPDGQLQEPLTYDNGPDVSQVAEVEVKTKQALKSSTFWRLALPFAYHMMVMSATVTHVMPYLSSIGLGRSISSLMAAAIPLMSIGGRLGLGWLADKIDRRGVATAGFAMMGLGLLCFGYISTTGTRLLVLFLLLFGIGYGGCDTLRPSLTREYFGRTNFGTILGLIIGIGAFGSIIGPTAAGWVYDNWGSYQGIWIIFAGLAVVAVISVLTIQPVNRREGQKDVI